jgi:transcription antitermination factor NusG
MPDTLQTGALPCGRNEASVGIDDGIRWTVAQTHPKAEPIASVGLRLAGYRTYLPRYARRRGGNGPRRADIVHSPLFSGYVFVALAPGQGWVAARYTRGVHRLCMAGDHPTYVAAGAVEALQAGDAVRQHLPPADSVWRPGAPCRLNGGSLAGLDAVVATIAGEVAVVHVLMLGELRAVTVDAASLCERRD